MKAIERATLQENIARVRENIADAAIRSNRSPSDIILVAATKTNSVERIQEALALGVDAAGENRVQELLEKYDQNAYGDKPLHFIGTLQTNKVRYLIGKVNLIESVGSIRLSKCISTEAQKQSCVQDILLEVNIGAESAKSGFAPSQLDEAICVLQSQPCIRIRGLMAIPPIANQHDGNALYFNKMHELFLDISSKKYDNVHMDYLSMGMSDDYITAVSCGSTVVRVGRCIFGARP